MSHSKPDKEGWILSSDVLLWKSGQAFFFFFFLNKLELSFKVTTHFNLCILYTHILCDCLKKHISETGHLKGKRQWWLITEKEIERHYIPKVKPKTSLSDPGTPPIAHSLKERDKTEGEVRKRERKIKRGGEWMREVKGPCRHLKSRQARA